jgi:Ni/Fe-hydrogenase subunit HybB-like protein
MAATVYVFGLEKYRPVARPAILTAFLGYLLVVAALLVDLGRPWAIWKPLVYWQPTSVMFEVAWCVALYTLVLALEYSPALFERLGLQAPLRIIRGITIPLVIAGVILSTLHQSSLGSLFLIVPHKLNVLWHTPILPVLFLVSAIMAGPAMVIVEGVVSARLFRREPEIEILAGLGRGLPYLLGLYLVLKVTDLVFRGAAEAMLTVSTQSVSLWLELMAGVVLPLSMLVAPEIRRNVRELFIASCLILGGVLLNRLNVAVIGIKVTHWQSYFPSWMELAVSAAIVAAGLLAFRLAVRHLTIYGEGARAR